MRASKEIQADNALSLLAFKTAPDVFDLSSGLSYLSIRDQIVRARVLVRDLHRAMPTRKDLLVVGAGAAGVAAACAASRLGMNALVLDTRSAPVSLQEEAGHRYVGPHMYEWPAGFSEDQHYPGAAPGLWPSTDPDCPQWGRKNPVTGQEFSKQIRRWLRRWLKQNAAPSGSGVAQLPMFLMDVQEDAVRKFVTTFATEAEKTAGKEKQSAILHIEGRTWPERQPERYSFHPEFVVLAAGMGTEQTSLAPGIQPTAPFWTPEPSPGPKEDVIVFGSGDGALQELLLCLTPYKHPLDFMKALRKMGGLTRRKLMSAERVLSSVHMQHQLLSSWTVDQSTEFLESKCEELAGIVVSANPASVTALLRERTGKLWLVSRGPRIGRAYLLNRFVFHLVRLAMQADPVLRERFEWRRGTERTTATRASGRIHVQFTKGSPIDADNVIVRWGAGGDDAPDPAGFQMVGISEEERARRTSLAQIPLPYLLPSVT